MWREGFSVSVAPDMVTKGALFQFSTSGMFDTRYDTDGIMGHDLDYDGGSLFEKAEGVLGAGYVFWIGTLSLFTITLRDFFWY